MTNKEKYKQAFSVLQSSDRISQEIERMAIMNKKAKMRTAAAAAAACAVLIGGSGIAYAADVGGIQRTIQLWIQGDQTTATFEYDGEGSYHISYPLENGEMGERGGGGIAYEADGTERPLTEEEILEELNESLNAPEVEYKDDGTVWVYYYDQKMEITDVFEDGVCYIKLTHGEETQYMTINYQKGYGMSPHKYPELDSFD